MGSRLILSAFWLVLSFGRSSFSMVAPSRSDRITSGYVRRRPKIGLRKVSISKHGARGTTPVRKLHEQWVIVPGWELPSSTVQTPSPQKTPPFLDTPKHACYGFYSAQLRRDE